MPNVKVDREKFLLLIKRFEGDIFFQRKMLDALIETMPENYVETFIEEYYLEHIYSGDYYVTYPVNYPQDRRYFLEFKDAAAYVKQWSMEDITDGQIRQHMTRNKPVAGLLLFKKKGGK